MNRRPLLGPETRAVRHQSLTSDDLAQLRAGLLLDLQVFLLGDQDTASQPCRHRFTLAIWVLQILIWALATLAVAGYTGLIRKMT